ncbi:GNAT family N-acetyltransferase [Litorimonas sp. WD9-15]|uniref:GNAT family N-acetyltransferase n=1 Tax=Litorimonas sp. WD9-15 TaxID=3418716 RepID=UPI003CFF0142
MRDVLKTERLVLRQIENSDAESFAELANDRDIARMTGSFPYPFPRLSVEFKVMYLRAQKRRGIGNAYAVTEIGQDKLIGVADLFRADTAQPWELGYWIGRPYWGKGYITEACAVLLAELETQHGPQRVAAGVFTDNPGSQRVLEKLGFQKDGATDMFFSMARLKKAPSHNYIRSAKTSVLAKSDMDA